MPRRRGLSLVELVIVLLVMGILAGGAAPTYVDAVNHYRVEAAAKRIVADLRYLRQQAIDSATTRTVLFDLATDSYAMAGVADLNHRAQEYSVSLAGEGYEADIISAEFDGSVTCGFDHRGVVVSAGSVRIVAGNHSRTVTVTLPHLVSISQ